MINAQMNFMEEMIIDNFAGGGGASTGIELAIGRPVDVAINHDPASIAMHRVNHPYTQHYCEDVWEIDPRKVTQGRSVALCWFSPDCKHFSKAKGGKPREKKIRGLAWVAVRWAATVKPRVIILENVEEFQTWGPLDSEGYPIKSEQGRTFRCFINALKYQGYKVKWKELKACDYGAPTIRKRFFLVARCDGKPIVFPKATHGEGLKPYHTAAECIDWTIAGKSIFKRKKPLVDNTLARIARGTDKFVIRADRPFMVRIGNGDIEKPLNTIVSTGKEAVVMPHLIQYHTETVKGEHRGQKIDKPIQTLDTSNRYGLVVANISKYYAGSDIEDPLPTITKLDHNSLQVAFFSEYYGKGKAINIKEPLHTITTRERNALIRIKVIKAKGELYYWPQVRELLNKYCDYNLKDDELIVFNIDDALWYISDITLRMLEPRELYNCQGFPPDYVIDFDVNGKQYSRKDQVARCGNSVPPPFAEALVGANLPELCGKKYKTMSELTEGMTA